MITQDENNYDAYHDDWLWGCKKETDQFASNGERVTTALALRIAADVLRSMDPEVEPCVLWTPNDMKLARAAIAGIRAQAGMTETGHEDDPEIHLTKLCDIAIYG